MCKSLKSTENSWYKLKTSCEILRCKTEQFALRQSRKMRLE